MRVVSCAEFLCAELRRFKLNDIEFYLPQFCNLLLTRQQYPQAIEEYAHTTAHARTHHPTGMSSLLCACAVCRVSRVVCVSCGCEQVAHRTVPQLAAPGPAHLLHHPGGRRGLHPRNPQTFTPPRTKTHGTRPRTQLRFVCRVPCRVVCVVSCRVVCVVCVVCAVRVMTDAFVTRADEATISFWLDEITLVKTLTRLSSMLNSVPLEQKSTPTTRHDQRHDQRHDTTRHDTTRARGEYWLVIERLFLFLFFHFEDTALRAMLGQLNGGLSVGLYLPITRADDVRLFLSILCFHFDTAPFHRPATRVRVSCCVCRVSHVVCRVLCVACRVCRVSSPGCSPTVAC
jgi:hypothetical protein